MKKYKWIVFIFTALASLLVLGPGIDKIPFIPGSQYSDLLLTHYPNVIYIQQALREHHTLPLWSNLILGGYPLYADPLSSLFYPPMWFAWLFPAPIGLNLIIIIHIISGGIGVYLFLKKSGYSFYAGIIGMLTFSWMPKLYAHLGAGHMTLIMAFCLIPWLLICLIPEQMNDKRKSNLAGLILGLIFLADPRIYPFAIGVLIIYMLVAHRHNFFSKIGIISKQTLISLTLAAPLLIPLLKYAGLSMRSSLSMGEMAIYSLPPSRLMGMLFPDLGGNQELITYFGAFGFLAVVLSCVIRPIHRDVLLWLAIFVFSILYGLGSNFIIFPILSEAPGINLLRVPTRIILLAGLAVSVISGIVVDRLPKSQNKSVLKLVLVILCTFITLLSVGIFLVLGTQLFEVTVGWIFLVVVTLLSLGLFTYKWRWRWAIAPVILLNLIIVNSTFLEYRPLNAVYSHDPILEKTILDQSTGIRIYSPSDSIPQFFAASKNLKLANGINPIQLETYVGYMEKATGVPQTGYSVTTPPFKTGNPALDNIGYQPDLELLGRLAVKYIISSYPMQMENAEPIYFSDQLYVYENKYARPMAWLQKSQDSIGVEYGEVRDYSFSPNQIQILASGPNQLVISENAYPGWVCKVDGSDTEINPIDIFISIELEPGVHEIQCDFLPVDLLIGVFLSLLALVSIVKPVIWN
ncbi:MAG: hypothetical protein HPY76_04745 [Anaerolineae bacterium]|jgi:hypothetical protein|nr:hypothetical protein [Anaerolineae bacterium]